MNNIIWLIGLPGSGKTTIAKNLDRKQFVNLQTMDLDTMIESVSGKPCRELAEENEEKFRYTEKLFIQTIIKEAKHSLGTIVVSLGGGAPCYNDVMKLLKSSGTVVYVLRNIDNITNWRTKEELVKLYNTRHSIYEEANLYFDNNSPDAYKEFGQFLVKNGLAKYVN